MLLHAHTHQRGDGLSLEVNQKYLLHIGHPILISGGARASDRRADERAEVCGVHVVSGRVVVEHGNTPGTARPDAAAAAGVWPARGARCVR